MFKKEEQSESRDVSVEAEAFEQSEYIEVSVLFINNSSSYSDSGKRYYYSIQNCLSDEITNLEIKLEEDGKELGRVTKDWLESFSEGMAEREFINISGDTCKTPSGYIFSTEDDREVGSTFKVSLYYKFEYKGKVYEFRSSESKGITVIDHEVQAMDELTSFKIDNSNITVGK